MYEAKNGKICNFWMIWPVIQLINDHKLQILLFSASYIASILKSELFHGICQEITGRMPGPCLPITSHQSCLRV